MSEFETKLIMEVQSHRCLYDKQMEAYKNKIKKADSWNEISIILNAPGKY